MKRIIAFLIVLALQMPNSIYAQMPGFPGSEVSSGNQDAKVPPSTAKEVFPTPQPPSNLDPNRPPQIDTLEISRLGNRVTVAGEGPRAGEDILYSMAMAPPEDDSDQWYITIWGHSKDANTEALAKSFEKDPHLSPFIAEPPPTHGQKHRPWAHFNVYYADDPMQQWRFKEYQIDTNGPFPVITLQPPRDGSFGGIRETTDAHGKKSARCIVIDRIEPQSLKSPEYVQGRLRQDVALWCDKLIKSGFVPPEKNIRQYYEMPEEKGLGSLLNPFLMGQSLVAASPISVAPTYAVNPSGSHGQMPPGAGNAPWGNDPPPARQNNPVWPANGPAEDPTIPSGNSLTATGLASWGILIMTVLSLWKTVAPMLGFKGVLAMEIINILKMLGVQPPAPVPTPAPSPAPAPFANAFRQAMNPQQTLPAAPPGYHYMQEPNGTWTLVPSAPPVQATQR